MAPGLMAGNPAENASAARAARLALFGSAVAGAAWLCPVRPGLVVGHSMEPSLQPWQLFFYNRRAPRPDSIRRGDVVLVRVGGQTCVKRVFALGGDTFWEGGLKHCPRTDFRPIRFGVPIR